MVSLAQNDKTTVNRENSKQAVKVVSSKSCHYFPSYEQMAKLLNKNIKTCRILKPSATLSQQSRSAFEW